MMADTKKPMRAVELPLETALSILNGVPVHTGRAMGVKIAGEDVIVIARNVSQLDTVFNYIEAHLHGGRVHLMDTLRTDRCPEVVIGPRAGFNLDDEL
jgi:hypothetical protein